MIVGGLSVSERHEENCIYLTILYLNPTIIDPQKFNDDQTWRSPAQLFLTLPISNCVYRCDHHFSLYVGGDLQLIAGDNLLFLM
jgi:hypothetical protein